MAVRAATMLTLGLGVVPPAAGEIIDRVLAVVNGSVITLSDVQGALRFGIVSAGAGDDVRAAVERLIDRRLALVEVERYAPPEPAESAIDAAFAAARARFPSEAAFAAALAESGMTVEQLRRHFRDDLRRQTYEEQRFGFAVHPTDEEVLEYFRAHPDRFQRGGVLPSFDQVRADVRSALIAERRAELLRDWMAGLRRRADVRVLPL
jgi:hypothetical protein